MQKYDIIVFLLFILISSCNGNPKNTSENPEPKISTETRQKIQKAFYHWALSEFKKGNFLPPGDCNPEHYISLDSLALEKDPGIGIPTDSSEINYSYTDLNGDKKTDALITFTPDQCDGGNALMWVQMQLLALSAGNDYYISDTFFDEIRTEPGFFHVDSATTNKIWGTYFEFKNSDGRCCPSIKKPIAISVKNKKLEFLKK